MKKITLLVVIISSLLSCNQNESTNCDSVISLEKESNKKIELSQFITSSKYIKLELNDDCFIGKVSKIKVFDGKIYILDCFKAKSLFVFDFKGNFLYKIGQKGKAANEYLFPQDFDIYNGKIYLLSDQKYITEFTTEGQFIDKNKLPISGQRIVVDDQRIIVMQTIYNGNKSHLLNIFSHSYSLVNKIYDIKLPPMFIQGYNYSFSDGKKMMFYSNFENKFISLTSDKEWKIALHFVFPKDCIITSNVLDEIMNDNNTRQWSEKSLEKTIWINNYIHTPQFDFVNLFKKNKPYIAFYEKQHDRSIVVPYSNVINDIDNLRLNFYSFEKELNNSIVSLIYPSDVIDAGSGSSSCSIAGINIHINDNPILVLYELKQDY